MDIIFISAVTGSIQHISRFPAKGTCWYVRPLKTKISMRIRIVPSEPSVGAIWVTKDPSFFGRKTKTLIRLYGCADLFDFLLYAHANLSLMMITGSYMRDVGFPTMWYVRPAKPQISPRIRAV